MGLSCIRSVAGQVPAGLVPFTQREVKSAKPLIRGAWLVPHKGIYYINEAGQGVRLQLSWLSVGKNGNGSVKYETEDGEYFTSSDVRFRTAMFGKKVIIRPRVWNVWSEEDRKVFTSAATKGGWGVVVRRSYAGIGAVLICAAVIAMLVWVVVNNHARNSAFHRDARVSGTNPVTIQYGAGKTIEATLTGERLEVKFLGGIEASTKYPWDAPREERMLLELAKEGRVFPELKGKTFRSREFSFRKEGGGMLLDRVVFLSTQ